MTKEPKQKPAKSIGEYISGFPKDVQELLQEVRGAISKAAPGAEEKISYAIPTFALDGKNLVHFAAFNNHIGFYPAPTGSKAFKKELSVYKTGKGSVQFPLHQPMPLRLITRIVEFRVKETLEKADIKNSSKAAAKRGGASALSDEEQVNSYMSKLSHPLKDEIEAIRTIIKKADGKIGERVKWAAPSYYYKEDLVTFNPRATKHVHLVFHNAAVANIRSPILEGDYKDRRMTYFRDMKEVRSKSKELEKVIKELIHFIDNQ